MNLFTNHIYYIGAFGLIFIGLYIISVKSNLIKVIIGLSILNTGINLFLIAIGYTKNGTAPIFSGKGIEAARMVDPVPQALVLTAIVIGVAILALALSLAIRLYQHYGTLNLQKMREQRWQILYFLLLYPWFQPF